jgi:hypothetical protein
MQTPHMATTPLLVTVAPIHWTIHQLLEVCVLAIFYLIHLHKCLHLVIMPTSLCSLLY